MSRFSDDVNRVFDELLRTRWGRVPRAEHHVEPGSGGLIWEVQLPVPGIDPDELGIAVSGGQLIVTIAAGTEHATGAGGAVLTRARYEQRRESFALPAGYRVRSIEARIVDHQLKLRLLLMLRSQVRA